jgi:hypothetical protein
MRQIVPTQSALMDVVGVDFSSRPSTRKPVVVARGRLDGARVRLQALTEHATLASFARWLGASDEWVGGFDFPFGLPRELVEHLGWPLEWRALIAHYAAMERAQIRATFAAFCDARPAGAKFAHRACDGPAGSSPSMKWVNPPVAYMLHAGVPLLIDAGVHLPGRIEGDRSRVALEAYPGLLAREIVGRRSYKADERAKQTPDRLIARKEIVDALEQGRTRLNVRLALSHAQRDALVSDPSADRLDAVLCMLQAAWAATRPNFGHPDGVDAIEGWIVSA